MNQSYSKKLEDPRWQKLRLLKMQEQDFTCEICSDKTEQLEVHHTFYRTKTVGGVEMKVEPWEYELKELKCLCHTCHTIMHLNLAKVGRFGDPEIGRKNRELQVEVDRYGPLAGTNPMCRIENIIKSRFFTDPEASEDFKMEILTLREEVRKTLSAMMKTVITRLEESGHNEVVRRQSKKRTDGK